MHARLLSAASRVRSQVAEVFAGYRSKRVWMPFYYDGKCADHLHSLGFENVVHQQVCHSHLDPWPPGQLPHSGPTRPDQLPR